SAVRGGLSCSTTGKEKRLLRGRQIKAVDTTGAESERRVAIHPLCVRARGSKLRGACREVQGPNLEDSIRQFHICLRVVVVKNVASAGRPLGFVVDPAVVWRLRDHWFERMVATGGAEGRERYDRKE